MQQWKGKIAVVTGASSGIGAEIARRLVQEGMIVVGFARSFDVINQAAKQMSHLPGKLYGRKCDLIDENSIYEAFKWTTDNVGPLSIIINNAAIALNTTLIDGDVDKWMKTVQTNILGTTICTKEAIRIMRDHKIDGHIVFINDTGGHNIFFTPGFNIYGSTKYALTNLLEYWRQELIGIGSKIRTCCVSPGCVRTEGLRDYGPEGLEEFKSAPELLPSDLADGVVFAITRPPHAQMYIMIIKAQGEKFL